jgi:NAD(P)-dependent dehydrogenase (short-subunit alcohol dehydrogenase family)
MDDFVNQVVIVTGSTRGIGKSIACAFAAGGAKVVVNGRKPEQVRQVVDQISASGGRALSSVADISVRAQVEAMIDTAIREFGKIDVLVNNAGILSPAPVLHMSEAQWDETFAVNVKGAFLCSQCVARFFSSQRCGRIINITSTAGKTPLLNNSAYCASKAALAQMTKVLALELADFGVTVNAVAPGTTETEMVRESIAKRNLTEMDFVMGNLDKWRLRIPLKKMGKPEDIASMVLFLPSEAASHITGQVIFVDGGQSIF